MADLSELQNLRHLIMGYETSNGKMTAYANAASDQEVKQFFQKSAQSAAETKQQLMKFLQQQKGVDKMEEKVMVADALESVNSNLTKYGEMIPQTENMQLRQTLKQIRNQCEMSQEELYQLAKSKQYYTPAAKATEDEVKKVRMLFSPGQSVQKDNEKKTAVIIQRSFRYVRMQILQLGPEGEDLFF